MLKLIPPGKRKGNRHYLVRGRLEGRDIEVSAETTDKSVAERFKNALERRILEGGVPGPEAIVGFHKVADLYKTAKNLGKRETVRIDKLKTVIANKPVRTIVLADIDMAASKLHPNDTPETKNRNVYTPAAAIMHYAAKNKWCEWLRMDRPKQRDPETRAAADDVPGILLEATTGRKHLLLLWLFKHGTRISGALTVRCDKIHLATRTYELYISKNRTWKSFPIDSEVWELLANDADVLAARGRLFPWTTKSGVYKWLTPLTEALEVDFTPHMARHWLGRKIGHRAGIRTVMDALGQKSHKSAMRYVAEDIDAVREATTALGRISGKRKASSGKD